MSDEEDPFAIDEDNEDDPFAMDDGDGDPFAEEDDEDPFNVDDVSGEENEEEEEVWKPPMVSWKYGYGVYDYDMLEKVVIEGVIRSLDVGTTRSEKIALLRSQRWKPENLANYWDNESMFRRKAGLIYDDVDISDSFSCSVKEYRSIPDGKKPDDEFECPVTWNDVAYSDTWIIPGNNTRVSTAAFSTMLKVSIQNDMQRALFLRYPTQKEDSQMVPSVLFSHGPLDDKFKRSYMERHVVHFVECREDEFKWCRNSGCSLILSKLMLKSQKKKYEDESEEVSSKEEDSDVVKEQCCQPVYCEGCNTEQCFNCGDSIHNPTTCAMVRAWNAKSKDNDSNEIWVKNNTKPCPKCKTKVAKDLGCLKMHCAKCNTEFCWKCLCSPYHGKNASGGYFRCEVTERKKMKRRNSFEKGEDRAKIKIALRAEEYNETFSKFLDCKEIAKSAKSEMKIKVKKLSDKILNSVHLTEVKSDLRYLNDAVRNIYLGSLANAWTWVHRFYEYDDPDDEEEYSRETILLDNYQTSLENSISDLSQELSLGKKQMLSLLKNENDSYCKFKNRIKNISGGIQKFTKSVISDIESGFALLKSVKNVGLEKCRAERWKYAQKWLHSKGLNEFGDSSRKGLPRVEDDDGNIILVPQKRRHQGLAQWELRLVNLQIKYPGRPWEAMMPQIKLPPEPVWSWQDQSGTWNPYNDSVIETIENAMKKHQSSVDIQSAGRTYRISISGNTQTNLTTGGSRVIRRTMESHYDRDWCCENCGYRMTDAKSKICTNCNHKRKLKRRRF